MYISKIYYKYQNLFWRGPILCLLLGFLLFSPPVVAGEEQVLESDLRAFCPPVEFMEDSYTYRVFDSRGTLNYQAAITDITRDCRYDHEKGLIRLHIAAAGRVVSAVLVRHGFLILPIKVKIARGNKILYHQIYRQKTKIGPQSVQFLFSEWVAVKKAEAMRGTKVFIGFADAGNKPPAGQQIPQTERLKNRKNREREKASPAYPDRISPNTGETAIPEIF